MLFYNQGCQHSAMAGSPTIDGLMRFCVQLADRSVPSRTNREEGLGNDTTLGYKFPCRWPLSYDPHGFSKAKWIVGWYGTVPHDESQVCSVDQGNCFANPVAATECLQCHFNIHATLSCPLPALYSPPSLPVSPSLFQPPSCLLHGASSYPRAE